jgi:hypothetical protein
MDAYDVIIIGIGAGGTPWLGTSRLRASASFCSSAATCSRASDLWPRHACMKNEIPVDGCAHQAGTCRFGMDPVTWALNIDCWADELDNLYVRHERLPKHRGGGPWRSPRWPTHIWTPVPLNLGRPAPSRQCFGDTCRPRAVQSAAFNPNPQWKSILDARKIFNTRGSPGQHCRSRNRRVAFVKT